MKTKSQAGATLARFGRACRAAADQNYRLAELAALYVRQSLEAAPGKAKRSRAVESLAETWMEHDEETHLLPPAQLKSRMRAKVQRLLRCHAVVQLLGDGGGPECGEGAKAKGKVQRLPWGIIRELCPLVERTQEEDDHSEAWRLLPNVEEEARSLFARVVAEKMKREDVVSNVARLLLDDAQQELVEAEQSGDRQRIRLAQAAVERWGGRAERASPAKRSRRSDEGEDEGDCRAVNLLQLARAATPQTCAEFAMELITGSDTPDDVFGILLGLAARCSDLCPNTRRALQAIADALGRPRARR